MLQFEHERQKQHPTALSCHESYVGFDLPVVVGGFTVA